MCIKLALVLFALSLAPTSALAWNNKHNASPHVIGRSYYPSTSGGAIKTTTLGTDANGNTILRVQHDGLDRVHIREKGSQKFLGYQSITR